MVKKDGLVLFINIEDHFQRSRLIFLSMIATFIFVVVLLLFDQTQLFKILILVLSGCFFMATS